MMRRLVPLLPVLFLLLPSCGDDAPSTPAPLPERYTLVEVGGAPLPAVVIDEDIPLEEGGSFRLKVVATGGWIELKEDGTYLHRLERTVTVDGFATPGNDWNDHGRYEAIATGLRFVSAAISPLTFDAEYDEGVEIRFQQDLSGEGRPIQTVYRR